MVPSLVLKSCIFAISLAVACNAADTYLQFVTEPSIRTIPVSVIEKSDDTSLLQSGYIFYAPFPDPEKPYIGPHIIDQDGQLIWWGNDTAKARVQNIHVCDFQGQKGKHICWSEATFDVFHGVTGTNRILDETYSTVGRDYGATSGFDPPNPHEFVLLPQEKHFLQAVYKRVRVDLRPYAGPEDGYVFDGCFQEVDEETGDPIFSWCGLDHLPIWHTKIFLFRPENVANWTGEPYGTGDVTSPWDYFHLNSVDKSEEGDYIVSARHLDQILKIAGNDNLHGVPPGTILWKVGGKYNEFINTEAIDLSRQHHVRIVNMTANETTLTVFNNQWEVNEQSRRISNGQIFVLNNESMAVTRTTKYYNPEGLISLAQGSMQLLPNHNVLLGWGTVPQCSEFSEDGMLLYHARFGSFNRSLGTDQQQNYRAYKYDWVGKPTWSPKVVAYSLTCTKDDHSPLVAYVSWNGATEVQYWRFYTSRLSRFGPWINGGTFRKDGFETKVQIKSAFGGLAGYAPYVMVEALDRHKVVLGSVIATTFVPTPEKAKDCNAEGCHSPEGFTYSRAFSCAGECGPDFPMHVVVIVALLVFVIEGVSYVSRYMIMH